MVELPIMLIAGYVVLSFPYTYRAVDTGLRAIDVRTLTEAAQSLGAGWGTILFQVIFPNLRVALLSGVFLTFAIVMGEFTFASLLSKDAFGPYMEEIGAMRAYTPQALSVVSFLITWLCIGLINRIARGAPGQGQIAGTR
jgi:putative spermidine/putrescine transport system permease protein